jgi:hypothetical protein
LVSLAGSSTQHATRHRRPEATPIELGAVATAGLLADGLLGGVLTATILHPHTQALNPLPNLIPGGLVSGVVLQEELQRGTGLVIAISKTTITTTGMAASDEGGQDGVDQGLRLVPTTILTVTRAPALAQPAVGRYSSDSMVCISSSQLFL